MAAFTAVQFLSLYARIGALAASISCCGGTMVVWVAMGPPVGGMQRGDPRCRTGPAVSSAKTASPVIPMSAAGEEPLEPRVALERREVGIDAEQAGRQVVRQLEQRLQLIERLLRLAHEEIDPDELMLHVRAGERILADGQELDAALPLSDRVRLSAQHCQSESE